jgi:cell division protein FtsB
MVMKFSDRLPKIRFNDRRLLLVAGVVIVVLLMMDFNNRMTELQRLTTDRDRLTTRVVQLTQTIQVLNTKIAYATSEVAVEGWAREQGKMIKTGDVPIVPISPINATAQPTPAVKPTQHLISNWDIWVALFMGKY